MPRLSPGVVTLLVCSLGAVPAALADKPHGGYVVRTPDPQTPRFGPGPQHRIIYMNRNPGTIHRGNDNSSTNTSSIPNQNSSQMTPWALGDAKWQELMNCTRTMFARFDVEITDVNPGPGHMHVMSVVAGYPQDIGWGNGVGGVAPMNEDCSVVEPAIVFTFAGVYGDDVQSICETVAQETSHALGLDHEHMCEDPMTYLGGCGDKTFQDTDAPCGEYSDRECMCGGSTQNSVQVLLDVLGPSDSIKPTVAITQPADGATVAAGFAIAATAMDNKAVTKVDLWVDGAFVQSAASGPYMFAAPAGLADGAHTVEVRAYDAAGNVSSDSADVTQGAAPGGGCQNDGDCASGESCVAGMCTDSGGGGGGGDDPGDLGDPCGGDGECSSGMCLDNGADGFCTQSCLPGAAGACPTGFACAALGGGGLCFPEGTDTDGGNTTGGCRVSTHGGAGGTAFALAVMLGLIIIRERRSQRRR